MKIGITADVHLRPKTEHPERLGALKNVIRVASSEGISNVIIAGDLFDKDFQDYVEFESLCKVHEDVQLHIIPGNHDPNITDRSIVTNNVQIYTIPTIVHFETIKVLFIPYEENKTMGEQIATKHSELAGSHWILIGHGDYYCGAREVNPYEPGEYMPLSRSDILRYSPAHAILGHIHKPHSLGNVHYVGSPHGLDVSETGKRRFLVYDTEENTLASHQIETEKIFFNESFVVVPSSKEAETLEKEIASTIQSWQVDPSENEKVRVRVSVKGYAIDRAGILETLKRGFDGFKFYKGEDPQIDSLRTSSDDQLNAIANRAMTLVDGLELEFGGEEPSKEEIKLAVLTAIYQIG